MDDALSSFFDQITTIRTNLEKMVHLSEEIKYLQYDILRSLEVHPQIVETVSQKMLEMKTITNDVRKFLHQTKQNLTVQQSAKRRIEVAQLQSVTHQFHLILNEHYQREITYREKCKTRLKRHCSLTGRSLTEEQLENLIERDYPSFSIPSVMIDIQNSEQSLTHLESQYNDIQKLELNIKELYDLFLEISELVQNQDEKLTSIQEDILKTDDFIQAAIIKPEQTKQLMTKKPW
ncbi:unnamed protein product, partial [Didymodactylos carnosus]